MSKLQEIKAPVMAEMEAFEDRFRKALKSHVPLLDKITHYIVKRKGKQMRPLFVFLSAKICGGITDSTYSAASLIELLHTATLVHDDVVDDAFLRRSFFSINALWKNKIAVLVGDYLLSRGLLLAVEKKEFALLDIVSDAVRKMSEGELLQIEKARKLDITEEDYYRIIEQKTASLIASCCASGASSAGADEETVGQFRTFGKDVGLAFQIKDDLFDYGTDDIGKPTGLDIKEKKMTLPLIYALNQADRKTRAIIVNLVRNHHEEDRSVARVIKFVQDNRGIEYAAEKMVQISRRALDTLSKFPESAARNSMEVLVRYTINRKR